MRLARINSKGKVLEVFEKESIEEKFNKDFIQSLKEIPNDVLVGDYFLKNKKIIKPDDERKVLNERDEWVYPKEIQEQIDLDQQLKNKREKIKELKNSGALTQKQVEELLLLVVDVVGL